jgi:uncharacterized membrane protein
MDWKYNKYGSAIGAFWGAALFLGALAAVVIGFTGSGFRNWLFAGITGALVFFICGLTVQGIITLLQKNS